MNLSENFTSEINNIVQNHLPSKHHFFGDFKIKFNAENSAKFLGKLYHNYQSAMHATRVLVYFLPYLNSVDLRRRKLKIFMDDDANAGNTHHEQLYYAFKSIGAEFLFSEKIYGELEKLSDLTTQKLKDFINQVTLLYPRSLGAWCYVEAVSDNWMRSMCDSLSHHFPAIAHEPYFKDCINGQVEERHGQEALELTLHSIENSSNQMDLYNQSIIDAKLMAGAMNLVWDSMADIVNEKATVSECY